MAHSSGVARALALGARLDAAWAMGSVAPLA